MLKMVDSSKWVGIGIGVFIVMTLLFALAPALFTSAAVMANDGNAPSWFTANIGTFTAIILLLVILGAGGLYAYRR
jgi:quinol-cytochrome oxidoreductase complex cytochrome b subunit